MYILSYTVFTMINTISATQVRNKFSEIISRVQYSGEEFVVEKQGNPVARITAIPKMTNKKIAYKPPVYHMGGMNSTFSRDEIYQ